MATKRFGYLDDLSLKNQKVGIGTSTASEKLEVIGGTRGGDVVVTGIATLTSSSGFLNKNTSYTGNIKIESGESGTLSGEIVIGAGLTMSVGTGATTGQGNIKSLKVSNTFTPPIGETNDRPSAPQPGALFYNKDFRTIEYWDGNFWRQVDNTTRRGRGIFAGGYSGPQASVTKQIDYFDITSGGNTINFGELINGSSNMGGCSSATRGLFSCAYQNPSSRNDEIDYIAIASGGKAGDFGDRTVETYGGGAVASSTRGVFVGGQGNPSPSPGNVNILDYVEIATVGNAIDFGDMATSRRYAGCVSSPTKAFICGGNTPSSTSSIDTFTIASKGNSTNIGDLTSLTANSPACSNSTRAVIALGEILASPWAGTKRLNSYELASTGNATDFGDLNNIRSRCAAAASNIRGVFGGGGPTSLNMDSVLFSSKGGGTFFGDLGRDTTTDTAMSGVSDSHGGLGGY